MEPIKDGTGKKHSGTPMICRNCIHPVKDRYETNGIKVPVCTRFPPVITQEVRNNFAPKITSHFPEVTEFDSCGEFHESK